VFRLKVLLSEVAQPRLAAPESRVRGYRGARMTILVADDEADHRDLVREVLVPLGFTLFTACDGGTCLDIAAQCRPNLVLLDVAMPDMTGWEAAQQLRALTPARPAIVMLSANPEEKRTDTDAPNIYDAYLMKPLVIQQLLDVLQKLLAIEWTDEPREYELPVPLRASVKAPAHNHIEDLLRLGEIGHVRGIHAKLQEIESQEPEHREFTDQIREIIRTFDLRRYMNALEAMRVHDAS
jgi:CheY-like chemotaxis protein